MFDRIPGAVRLMAEPGSGPLPPLVHPTTSLQAAVDGQTLGVGYAAAGFLVFYYVGVTKILQQLGVIVPGTVRTAGSSVGSLAQGINHIGMGTTEDFLAKGTAFANRCRSDGMRGCFGTLDVEYTKLLDSVLKPNVSEAITGRACIVYSRNTTDYPVGEYICDFTDRDAVIDALRTSAFVPGWSASHPTRMYNGAPGFDGIFSQMLPCPPGVTYCIKISALPPFDLQRSLHGLLDPREVWATLKATFTAASHWLGSDPLESLKEAYRTRTLEAINPMAWAKIIATNQRPMPDIVPGRWRRSALSPTQWFIFMLNPPDEATIQIMYEEGQKDAAAWAHAQGWTAPREYTVTSAA